MDETLILRKLEKKRMFLHVHTSYVVRIGTQVFHNFAYGICVCDHHVHAIINMMRSVHNGNGSIQEDT